MKRLAKIVSKQPRPNKTLDRDLKARVRLEQASIATRRPYVAPSIAGVFIILAGLLAIIAFGWGTQSQTQAPQTGAQIALFDDHRGLGDNCSGSGNTFGLHIPDHQWIYDIVSESPPCPAKA